MDLNEKGKTIIILEKNHRKKFSLLGLSRDVLDLTQKAEPIRRKKWMKWTSSKLKTFPSSKVHTKKKKKRQTTDKENIFADLMTNIRLVPKLYKEVTEQNSKKLNIPI